MSGNSLFYSNFFREDGSGVVPMVRYVYGIWLVSIEIFIVEIVSK